VLAVQRSALRAAVIVRDGDERARRAGGTGTGTGTPYAQRLTAGVYGDCGSGIGEEDGERCGPGGLRAAAPAPGPGVAGTPPAALVSLGR
jgi:hypothetical protein